MKNKIIGTVTGCAQVGQNEYRDIHTSKIFNSNTTLQEIEDWAKQTLRTESYFSFNQIKFSELIE